MGEDVQGPEPKFCDLEKSSHVKRAAESDFET